MSHKTLLERLTELEAKACPAPWRVDGDPRPNMEWNNHIMYGPTNHMAVCFMAHSGFKYNEEHEAAAELIVALRNAWPEIKQALSAAPDQSGMVGMLKKPTMSEIQLACGELNAGERRAVNAVVGWIYRRLDEALAGVERPVCASGDGVSGNDEAGKSR